MSEEPKFPLTKNMEPNYLQSKSLEDNWLWNGNGILHFIDLLLTNNSAGFLRRIFEYMTKEEWDKLGERHNPSKDETIPRSMYAQILVHRLMITMSKFYGQANKLPFDEQFPEDDDMHDVIDEFLVNIIDEIIGFKDDLHQIEFFKNYYAKRSNKLDIYPTAEDRTNWISKIMDSM